MPNIHLVSSMEEPKSRGIIFIGYRDVGIVNYFISRDKQNGELHGRVCHRQTDRSCDLLIHTFLACFVKVGLANELLSEHGRLVYQCGFSICLTTPRNDAGFDACRIG
jgi:hypothetical protein